MKKLIIGILLGILVCKIPKPLAGYMYVDYYFSCIPEGTYYNGKKTLLCIDGKIKKSFIMLSLRYMTTDIYYDFFKKEFFFRTEI